MIRCKNAITVNQSLPFIFGIARVCIMTLTSTMQRKIYGVSTNQYTRVISRIASLDAIFVQCVVWITASFGDPCDSG